MDREQGSVQHLEWCHAQCDVREFDEQAVAGTKDGGGRAAGWTAQDGGSFQGVAGNWKVDGLR